MGGHYSQLSIVTCELQIIFTVSNDCVCVRSYLRIKILVVGYFTGLNLSPREKKIILFFMPTAANTSNDVEPKRVSAVDPVFVSTDERKQPNSTT